jgi:ParB family chromosome partitioning protein
VKVKSVFIDDIHLGDRRREDFGDIEGLAESINKYGLFHPIVLDAHKHLVAGERRLRACNALGWVEIPARMYAELTPEEMREIELEENLQRKDLTPFEASKRIVKQAENAAPFISAAIAEKKGGETRGRKSTYEAPKDDVAKAIGISGASLRNAEQHVEAVTKYPELSVVPTQKGAIDAARKLDALPEPERESVLSRLATEGKTAVEALKPAKPKTAASNSKPKPASGKYATNLSQIQVFISTIQSVGAEELTANWTDREIASFLEEMRECRDGMSAIVADMESVVSNLQRQAS